MSNLVRAWKDEAYRQSLSPEEQAMLPANPAGEIELTEVELAVLSGVCGGFDQSPHPNFFDGDQAEAMRSFRGQQLNFTLSGPVSGGTFAPTITQTVGSNSCNVNQSPNTGIWENEG